MATLPPKCREGLAAAASAGRMGTPLLLAESFKAKLEDRRGTCGADANHLSNVIEDKTESVTQKVAAGREIGGRREVSLVSPDGNVVRKVRHC
ncbi:hypothetical protein E2C01_077680 [Portunus trituberculatus]|uniref:Uncharacterized protein n=1 Tax=Portunus trituberculatus TaxID=210409 RepID=A0A5B7IC22_PORTR|nr:hypothetical protein [Portunus trituberculatus]